jgi:hypothetical protein
MIRDLLDFFIFLSGGIAMTILADMASEEIRDRLDYLPHAILRLAARQLTQEERITIYYYEWLPELIFILKGTETRPITRLVTGTKYAVGILINARRIAHHLHRAAPHQSRTTPLAQALLDRASLLRKERTLMRKEESRKHRLRRHEREMFGYRTGPIKSKDYNKRGRLQKRLARIQKRTKKIQSHIHEIDVIIQRSDN